MFRLLSIRHYWTPCHAVFSHHNDIIIPSKLASLPYRLQPPLIHPSIPPFLLSLPLSLSGKFPLAYSFQNSIAPIFAAKAFGAFDMCQAPSLYSWNAMQTHFCTLAQDVRAAAE